jgi:hypothetical protein
MVAKVSSFCATMRSFACVVQQVFGSGSAPSLSLPSKDRRFFFARFHGYHFMDLGDEPSSQQAESGGEEREGLYCLPCLLFCLCGVLSVYPAVHGPLGTRAPTLATLWPRARLYFMSPK